MNIKKLAAVRLTWEETSEMIQLELDRILGYPISCRAQKDDMYYWCAVFPDTRMLMSDVFKVFETLNATVEQRVDSIPTPEDRMISVDCLGMAVCELLLQHGLQCKWEETHIGDDALWLLDVHDIQ